jgi:hypothetical protein
MPPLAVPLEAVALVGGVILLFFIVALPLVVLLNKMIGAMYERQAEHVKASLGPSVMYAEDGVRLRVAGIAPLAVSVRWLWADVRVDGHALYVLQYHNVFGRFRMGQPNLRVTWNDEAAQGGLLAAPISGQPSIDGDAVVVSVRLRLSALTLRLRAREPNRLFSAIQAMR